jgi:hypothetical protein
MLAADDLSTLRELLTPPAGTTLDAAVAATFSLDLVSLCLVPTAMALASGITPEEVHDGAVTPLELLDSIRRMSDRITVFCQAGQITVPSQGYVKLFASLEISTVPVSAPRGGVFHPKLWALRFTPTEGGGLPQHRVLIASRNLTFDRSWDTVVRLEQAASGARLDQLAQFIDNLPSLAVTPVAPVHRQRVGDLARTLAGARFAAPDGFGDLRFHALGLSQVRSSRDPLPRNATRLLIVSPFLSAQRLRGLPVHGPKLTVVSRPEQLDAALAPTDGVQAYELAPDLNEATDAVIDNEHGGTEPADSPLHGLHAKIYVADTPAGTRVFTGSANATVAAFNQNVEILLEMHASGRAASVAAWLAPGPRDAAGKVTRRRFRDLLVDHEWAAPQAVETELGALLDQLQREIAKIPVTVDVSEPTAGTYRVAYRSTQEWPLPPGVTATVRPLSLGEATACPVGSGETLNTEFAVTLAGLTAFLVVQLTGGDDERRFVLVGEMRGAPLDRLARLLAENLADTERLVRFLLLILLDPDEFPLAAARAFGPASTVWDSDRIDTAPLLETMVRALVRRSHRLDDIDRILAELRDTGVVPDELQQLWASISAARAALAVRRA